MEIVLSSPSSKDPQTELIIIGSEKVFGNLFYLQRELSRKGFGSPFTQPDKQLIVRRTFWVKWCGELRAGRQGIKSGTTDVLRVPPLI